MQIPDSLDDDQAERIGAEIVKDFKLKRSSTDKTRWLTESGDYAKKGIARRALRMIQEGI